MDNLLTIKNLKIYFKTPQGISKVVENVNLNINNKEVVGLIGETGCGKSIILKSILGILPKTTSIIEGEIIYKGVNLINLPEKEYIKYRGVEISYIPQHPLESLFPVFTVEEQFKDLILFRNIIHVSRFKYYLLRNDKNRLKEINELIVRWLKDVGISNTDIVLKQYPFELSGGLAQRVLIAMALSGNPSLLLADEPTTALDVTIQKQIIDLLNSLISKYQFSVLFVTHNLGIAKMLTKKIYIMYAGKIVEYGNTEKIFKTPLHPYTIGLLEAIPKLTGGGMKSIEGSIPNYISPPNGCRFYPRCPYAMDVCKIKEPPLIKINEDHYVACFLKGSEKNG